MGRNVTTLTARKFRERLRSVRNGHGVFQILIFHVDLRKEGDREIYECTGFDEHAETWKAMTYDLGCLIFLYLLPLVVICISYGLIYRQITKETQSDPKGIAAPAFVDVK